MSLYYYRSRLWQKYVASKVCRRVSRDSSHLRSKKWPLDFKSINKSAMQSPTINYVLRCYSKRAMRSLVEDPFRPLSDFRPVKFDSHFVNNTSQTAQNIRCGHASAMIFERFICRSFYHTACSPTGEWQIFD